MELWVHGLPQDRKSAFETLKRLGIANVVLGADRVVIDEAVAAGFSVYPCTHAFGIRKGDPESLLCLNIKGERKAWFYSNCPSQPEVQERHLKKVQELAAIPGVKGVFVDAARFASPASGIDAFFTCFCDRCRARAEGFGFDFERMRREVALLFDRLHGAPDWMAAVRSAGDPMEPMAELPGVVDWLCFRASCTAEHMRQVREALKACGTGLSLGMYVFTPCLSPLVGQVYPVLEEHVDIFAPMIYRNGPPDAIAPVNSEFARLWKDVSEAAGIGLEDAARLVLRFAGYEALLEEHSPGTLAGALPPSVVAGETARARARIGPERNLVPIIWLDDADIERSALAVREAGADGVSFFSYRDGSEVLLERAVAALSA